MDSKRPQTDCILYPALGERTPKYKMYTSRRLDGLCLSLGGTARDGVLELSPVCSFLLAVNQHNSTNMAGFVRFCVSVCVSVVRLIEDSLT